MPMLAVPTKRVAFEEESLHCPWFCSTQESLQEAVRKGIARSKAADVQDLPAIVHQLLMLAAKGCRDTVLLVRREGTGACTCCAAVVCRCPHCFTGKSLRGKSTDKVLRRGLLGEGLPHLL